MPDIVIACAIDNRPWSCGQLAMVEYDRHRHVLREMKRLGATIELAGGRLTHEEIGFLKAADARTACITARQSYGVDDLTHLYRTCCGHPTGCAGTEKNAAMQFATADVTVTGLNIEDLGGTLGPASLSRDYALLNPDHYFIEENGDGMHAMGAFGMYGAPDRDAPHCGPGHPGSPRTGSRISDPHGRLESLARDATEINVLAFHQYKPLENGFTVKLGSLYPAATPTRSSRDTRSTWPSNSSRCANLQRVSTPGCGQPSAPSPRKRVTNVRADSKFMPPRVRWRLKCRRQHGLGARAIACRRNC